jgi:hypothetical protein
MEVASAPPTPPPYNDFIHTDLYTRHTIEQLTSPQIKCAKETIQYNELEARLNSEVCQLNLWRDNEYSRIKCEYERRGLVIAMKSRYERDHIHLMWDKQMTTFIQNIEIDKSKGYWEYIKRIITFNYK